MRYLRTSVWFISEQKHVEMFFIQITTFFTYLSCSTHALSTVEQTEVCLFYLLVRNEQHCTS